VTIIFNVVDIERTRAFYGEHLSIRFECHDDADGTDPFPSLYPLRGGVRSFCDARNGW
jgi:catechol 2,3-dioxygenase-like lactoylglutathione lyase family enzyme